MASNMNGLSFHVPSMTTVKATSTELVESIHSDETEAQERVRV